MKNEEILTGFTYYQYHLIGGLTFAGFAIYQYLYGHPYVAISNGIAACSILALITRGLFYEDSKTIKDFILLTIMLAIFSASYFVGITGIIWVFPLVMAIFFNHSHVCALMVSLFASVCALSLAANVVDVSVLIKTFFALALSISFAYVYRVAIVREQTALKREANIDYLTGISNRRSFHKWLSRAIPLHNDTNRLLAVFYLDLDDFKQMNDTYGHEFGDRVLQKVSNRLVESVRETDVVCRGKEPHFARIAGDEFVIATAHLELEQHADVIAHRLLSAINRVLNVDGIEMHLSGSIGVALCHNRDITAEELLAEADAAMYRSKETGKNRITYFSEEIARQLNERQCIARGIEAALRNDEFYLHFMPIFRFSAAKQRTLAGAEVLIRCHSPVLAEYGPDKYIPVAEEFGSIKDIDLMVIKKTFQTIASVINALPEDFIVAINISALELRNEDFPRQLAALTESYGIRASSIELEITETSLVSHDEKSIAMLGQIKGLGFRLSLDDFGTGYTAFSQLHHYPIDTLKVDRSFVWDITNANQKQEKMVDVILSLAKLYGVTIVAEGVEDQVQLDYLIQANCDLFQGFYLSEPLPWEQFREEFLTANIDPLDRLAS